MAKFDAATAVEPIEYDFSEFGGASGVTPEPTTDALDRFMDELRVLFEKIRRMRDKIHTERTKAPEGVDPEGEEDLAMEAAKLVEMDELRGASKEILKTMQLVIADLTQGKPSEEDLAKLPQRVFMAYLAWLVDQLKPKAITPGTRV